MWEIVSFGRLPYGDISSNDVLLKLSLNHDVTPWFQALFTPGFKSRCLMALVSLALSNSQGKRPAGE